MRTVMMAIAFYASTIVALAGSGLGYDDSFQISYLSNPQLDGSLVTLASANFHGSSVPGVFICANVYVFSPDEFMVSCCSCAVTGHGIVSLSGTSLLAGVVSVPTRVTVKLVATLPVSGPGCAGNATAPTPKLAIGLRAWATRVHTATPNFGTETAFENAPLGPMELGSLTSTCSSSSTRTCSCL